MITFQCRDANGRVLGEQMVETFDAASFVDDHEIILKVKVEFMLHNAPFSVHEVGMLGTDGCFRPIDVPGLPEIFSRAVIYTVDVEITAPLPRRDEALAQKSAEPESPARGPATGGESQMGSG